VDENNNFGELLALLDRVPGTSTEKRLGHYRCDSSMHTFLHEATAIRVKRDRLRGHSCIDRESTVPMRLFAVSALRMLYKT
jgi:hypothetical protein